MGKLIYVNRKIQGDKLGQVICKDILKRTPSGSGHKAALRDPSVEFDVTGKNLSDAAVRDVCNAFASAYSRNRSSSMVIKLEEICLRSNGLTAECLEPLSAVIRMGSKDIKDLDLSENMISIISEQDARSWSTFLSAIGSCCTLRRLELSGNDLSTKGFEILTRVYLRNSPKTATHLSTTPSTTNSVLSPEMSQQMQLLSIDTADDDPPSGSSQVPSTSSIKPLANSSIRREAAPGLRHIPYIVLDRTSITCTSAMYLSYVIASHEMPAKLLCDVALPKAGQQTQQLEAYDMDKVCQGVMYRGIDKTIGTPGLEVLHFAENARPRSTTPIADQIQIQEDETESQGSRARSLSSVASNGDSPGSRLKNLDTTRSRIQGTTIQDAGIHSNDLWSSALKMLVAGRAVLLGSPFHAVTNGIKNRIISPYYRDSFPDILLDPRSPLAHTHRFRSIPMTPLAPASPNAPVLRLQKHRLVEDKPPKPAVKRLSVKVPKPRTSQPYRSKLMFGFSEDTWSTILGMATGASSYLSARQQLNVVRWAGDKATLRKEQECLGKLDRVQIWNVLHGMDCLAYEPFARKS